MGEKMEIPPLVHVSHILADPNMQPSDDKTGSLFYETI